jgi:hypothetical protein
MLVQLDPTDARVEQIWRALESQASPSFFLSWGWIENWLASLPRDMQPRLAIVLEDDLPAAAFFLGRRRITRLGVMASEALFVNATGSPRLDRLAIEHNGILRANRTDCSLATVLAQLPGEWDELYMPAVDRAAFPELPQLRKYRVRIDRDIAAPFVDLETVRAVDGGYLSVVGAMTRAQIRRGRRALGDLAIEVAGDLEHAIDIYGELLRLHGRRARDHGLRGAFADPWFEKLHRRLITERLRHGEIQLVRVRAGDRTIGCLYNFVYRGRVLFYQAGFEHDDDPHNAPYLCHSAAIELNAASGHAVYDLVAGDDYARHLATGESRMVWLRVQRKLVRFQIEARLRAWREAIAGMPLLPSRT